MGFKEFTQTKQWKEFMAKLYGLGAAVVIVGALFKIQHWPMAGFFLIVGLSTEAVIFIFSAFEPVHEELDWSLVYPELAGMHGDEKDKKKKHGTPTQELDNLLEKAKIGPELLESVGKGLHSLGESTSKLADITDASVATSEYVSNVKKASSGASELSVSYAKATEAMSELSSSTGDLKNYNEQLQSASKNLGALNAVYELQLQDSNSYLKASTKLNEGINELMENLSNSTQDTKKYREEIARLAQNLSSLNTIYGNMLSAMTNR